MKSTLPLCSDPPGASGESRQIEDLFRNGAPGGHFYTLNKAHSTVKIVRNLGLA